MSETDLSAFCTLLVRSKLLSEDEVSALRSRARADSAAAGLPEGFASWLVKQDKLTPFQADSLLRGNARFVLDDYRLVDRIGTGRMAGVYEAKHAKLGLRVAIKILPPSRAKQAESLSRFQREAQLALRLDHPHIVRTYHAGASDGLHYIAMEYLEGATLEERIAAQGKFPPHEACRIIHQTLQALQHLHEASMVHRDVKPGNIMLVPIPHSPGDEGPSDAVKVLDIGLGRALFDEEGAPTRDLTLAGTLLGTPDYMAPEQARDSHAADIRSDIYSLGCVFYQCLTGQVPFPDKSAVVKLAKHTREMPAAPVLSDYPHAAALQAVLWKMMAKDPAMRYTRPVDAAKALEPFLTTRSTPPIAVPVAPPVVTASSRPAVPPPPAPKPAVPPIPPPVVNVERVDSTDPATLQNLRQWLIGVSILLILMFVLLVVVVLLKRRGGQEREGRTPSMQILKVCYRWGTGMPDES